MIYYKTIENGYIVSVQMANASQGGNITESEYRSIMEKIQNKPADSADFAYCLRADTLEWERIAIEPSPLTEEDALTHYANTITGAADTTLVEAAETLIEQRIKEV